MCGMKMTTIEEAQTYLESFIKPTVFAQTEEELKKLDPIKRVETFLALLGNPHQQFPAIQVSGTSGKGSTSFYISSILTKAGYKTGFTMGPHLQKVHERLQINNVAIDDASLVALVNEAAPLLEKMSTMAVGEPTYYEILFCLAMVYFAKEKVDIAVVEVGLEGRYDASNVLTPSVAVLTNIDLDHVEYLGDTVEKIAGEAVSIIKNLKIQNAELFQVIVTGVKQESVTTIVEEQCQAMNASMQLLGKDFYYERNASTPNELLFSYFGKETIRDIHLSMRGDYQMENATLAIRVIEELQRFGFTVPEEAIRDALHTAYFPGRFEVISLNDKKKRTLILDGAHNPAKMQAFLTSLAFLYPDKRKIFVLSFKHNKDISQMLAQIIRVADEIVVTKFTVSMGYVAFSMDVEALDTALHQAGATQPVHVVPTVKEALQKAVTISAEDGLIVCTGSLYLIGEAKNELQGS